MKILMKKPVAVESTSGFAYFAHALSQECREKKIEKVQ
jgi:hypothetical protein